MIRLHLHLSNLNCSVCVVPKISYMSMYMYVHVHVCIHLLNLWLPMQNVHVHDDVYYMYATCMFTNFKFCSLVVLQFNDPVLFLPPSPSHPLRLLLPSSHTGYTHLVMVEMTGAGVVSSHQITTGNWCVLGDQVSIHAV